MTQDEIIEMAKQAGFEEQFTRPQDAIVRKGFALSGEFKGYKANNAVLEAFAKLVEERCCSIIRDNIPRSGHDTKEYVFAFKLIDAIKRGQA